MVVMAVLVTMMCDGRDGDGDEEGGDDYNGSVEVER